MSQGEPSEAGVEFKRILVGVDPASSCKLIATARYLAERLGTEVLVAYVAFVQTGVAGNERDGQPATTEEKRVYDSLQAIINQAFGEQAPRVRLMVLHGDAAERLSEYAAYSKCDLIVVGSRHMGALKSALVGSVSSGLIRKSAVPVLVLK